ncbi:hypothetical protein CEXT_748521 [Caerostris extrusa]|uniref:Uncharacterized protein n=1 Tax=Caerostris extrusa TaxID=172846 RepID=A0AAV4NBC7_CAEEX|nr:hypothetical protein CEXT_748521 [Caerostris extrusa]
MCICWRKGDGRKLAPTYQQSDIKEQLAENWKNPRRHFSDSVAVEDLPESGVKSPSIHQRHLLPPSHLPHPLSILLRGSVGRRSSASSCRERTERVSKRIGASSQSRTSLNRGVKSPSIHQRHLPSSVSSSASSSPSSSRDQLGGKGSASICRERTACFKADWRLSCLMCICTTYQQCDIKEQLAENWKNPRRNFSDIVAGEDLPESGAVKSLPSINVTFLPPFHLPHPPPGISWEEKFRIQL